MDEKIEVNEITENIEENPGQEQKTSFDLKALLTKRNIIIAAVALVLVALLIVTIALLGKKDGGETPDSGEQAGDTTPETDNNGGEPEDNEPEKPVLPAWMVDPTILTYAEYLTISPEERKAHYDLFTESGDYFAWFNAAKQAYDDANQPPEIDGDIDLGNGSDNDGNTNNGGDTDNDGDTDNSGDDQTGGDTDLGDE
jgi:hypothetical protein